MERITRNVFAETAFRGCNPGFIITGQGVVMIDTPQRPSDAIKWKDEITKYGQPLYIINTENHQDHITGNAFFPIPVIAHQGTKELFSMSLGSMEELKQRIQEIDPDGLHLMENYQPNPPTITFTHRLTLYLAEHIIELIHLPGHTPNEIAVYIPNEKVVFTGDNVFNNIQVFFHQAKPKEWLNSLEVIKNMEIDHIGPGHGEVCGKEVLGPMGEYIEMYMGEMQKAIDAGMEKEEVIEKICGMESLYQRPLPPGIEAYIHMIKRMMAERVYEDLSALPAAGRRQAGLTIL